MVLVAAPSDGSLRGTLRARDGREFLVCVSGGSAAPWTAARDANGGAMTNKRTRRAPRRQLRGDPELLRLLRPHRDLVDLRLQQAGTLAEADLEKDLLEVLEHALKDDLDDLDSDKKAPGAKADQRGLVSTARPVAAPLQFCSRVVAEIEALGWDHIASVSRDMRALEVIVYDAAGRRHALHLHLPASYPNKPARLEAAVPEALDAAAPGDLPAARVSHQAASGLRGIVQHFRERIDKFQGVWDELDDLDAHVWVLDPIDVDYSILYRRIALAKHCSVQVRLTADAPRSVCECQFMGSEAVLGPFRKRFNRNMRKWDRSARVRENLLRVLELKAFPQKDAKEIGDQQECGVCYCVRLPVEAMPAHAAGTTAAAASVLPDCVCPNPKCSRGFHPACLRDWFQALPTTRHTFDTMFGACPYCAGPISVLTA